jgi:hypothetical protein
MKRDFDSRYGSRSFWMWRSGSIAIALLFATALLAAPQESRTPAKKRPAAGKPDAKAAKKPSSRPNPGEIGRSTLHGAPIRALAVSHDGQYVATAGEDRLCCVLSGPQLKMARMLGPQGMPLTGVAWMRDRTLILAGKRDTTRRGSVFFWDWASSSLKRTLTDSEHDSHCLQLSNDEEKLAVAMNDNDARFWHLPSDSRIGLESPHKDRKCRCVAFSPDSKILLVGSGGGILGWHVADDMRGGAGNADGQNDALTHSIAFSPDGATVVTGHADGAVRLWTAEDLSHQKALTGHTGDVFSVQFSPDGKRIASGGADKTIRVWNATTGEIERKFTGHTDGVSCVAFYGSNDRLVSGSLDKTVRAWDMTSKETPSIAAAEFEIELHEDSPTAGLRPKQRGELAVPATAQLEAANKLLREIFRDEFSKSTDAAKKRKLAEKLLALGRKKENEPAERHVALAAARGLAIESASVALAVDAAVQMSSLFDIDDLALLAETIERLGAAARTASVRAELADVGLRAVDMFLAARRFDEAQRVAKTTDIAAKRAGKPELIRQTRELNSRISGAKTTWTAYQAALKKLRSDPKDADAHLTVGKHLLFVDHDWRKALGHLSKSNDELLSAAAAADRANPKDPDAQIAVAARWQEAAIQLPKASAEVCNALALYWYERALPRFTGLKRLKLEKEIKAIGEVPAIRQED